MIKYTTITTEDECYSLSALIINNEYTMPSLTFKLDGQEVDSWDNEEYLYRELYPYLLGLNDDYDGLDNIFSNVKKQVLEIFEEAIRMGFFNKLIIKSNE